MKRIDILPDDVLLDIFDFYMDMCIRTHTKAWQTLVHVCRRWRSLVLGSPRRLNLRLYCTPKTPTNTLNVWPALPLRVVVESRGAIPSDADLDNVIAAFGQSNRVHRVELSLLHRQLGRILAAMQAPFPELTQMKLCQYLLLSDDVTIPDSFLGGSAPRLQSFHLSGISFPGFPKLLLSASHLVDIQLTNIPHSGYISPEVIVALLSALSRLETLSLTFQSRQSPPGLESRSLPPLKRCILPVLYKFIFGGVTEYLGELVARIDTPQLDFMSLKLLDVTEMNFGCLRLVQFINRTPTLSRACYEARVELFGVTATVTLRYRTSESEPGSGYLPIEILCRESNRRLPSIGQVCNSSLHPLSTVEDLYIMKRQYCWETDGMNDTNENTLWLQFLLPFTAVRNLYLSRAFALDIAAALKELAGGRVPEVLPSLQNVFAEKVESSWESFKDNIEQFSAARRYSDHPINIHVWGKG